MNIKITFNQQIDNDLVIDTVNYFQDNHNLENFEYLDEVPNEIILMALDYDYDFIEDIIREELDLYSMNLEIIR